MTKIVSTDYEKLLAPAVPAKPLPYIRVKLTIFLHHTLRPITRLVLLKTVKHNYTTDYPFTQR